jgi:ABC-type multidrug transport system fused ATPase/permease subunit
MKNRYRLKNSFLISESLTLFALSLMSRRDKLKLLGLSLNLAALSILDVVSVVFLGALAALLIGDLTQNGPGDRLTTFLEIVRFDSFTYSTQAMLVVGVSIVALVLRTILTIFLTRLTLKFLSLRAAQLSQRLFVRLMEYGIAVMKKESFQRVQFAINRGVDIIIVQSIGTSLTLVADVMALILIFTALLLIDPVVSVSAALLFVVAGISLYKLLSNRTKKISFLKTEYEISANMKVAEAFSLHREIFVRNGEGLFASRYGVLRMRNAEAVAESTFLPSLTKFFIEITLILGAILVGVVQFAIHDAIRATATVSLFLAASLRIAPAVIRIQQSVLAIRANSGLANPTIKLISEILNSKVAKVDERPTVNVEEVLTHNVIEFESVNYSFDDGVKLLTTVSFEIKQGEFIGLIGESGSGKSTLVDLLVGIRVPNSGSIKLFGQPSKVFISANPFAVSYVPQEVSIADGTLKENLLVGYDEATFSDEQIYQAIRKAQLEDFVQSLSNGIRTRLGSSGVILSGGQKQRIGLARALLNNPSILVLDEATSSLDATTEEDFMRTILSVRGETTIVMIAHRLSLVQQADKILVLEKGSIVAAGDFNHVREKVASIKKNALILGL